MEPTVNVPEPVFMNVSVVAVLPTITGMLNAPESELMTVNELDGLKACNVMAPEPAKVKLVKLAATKPDVGMEVEPTVNAPAELLVMPVVAIDVVSVMMDKAFVPVIVKAETLLSVKAYMTGAVELVSFWLIVNTVGVTVKPPAIAVVVPPLKPLGWPMVVIPVPEKVKDVSLASFKVTIELAAVLVLVLLIVMDVAASFAGVLVITTPAVPEIFNVDKLMSVNVVMV